MANIDKDLISNKASCYIFDIDGCIADVDHLLLTYEQAYEKNMEAFNLAEEKYKSDYNAYQYDLKQYNKNLLTTKPIEPIAPIRPAKYDANKKDRWDVGYFYNHIEEAIPVGGVLDLFIALALTKKVIFLTGRNESSRPATLEWLKKAIGERSTGDMFRRINFQMIFKPDKNNDSTEKFKREKILELAKQYNIQFIIDDCPANIEEFTKLGFFTLTPNRIYKDLK